jgi:hypothetical protein
VTATVRSMGDILREAFSPEAMRRCLTPTPEERAEDERQRRAALLATPPLTEEHTDPPYLDIDAELDGQAFDIRCHRVAPGKYIPNLDDLRELLEEAVESALRQRKDQLEYDREERKPR